MTDARKMKARVCCEIGVGNPDLANSQEEHERWATTQSQSFLGGSHEHVRPKAKLEHCEHSDTC